MTFDPGQGGQDRCPSRLRITHPRRRARKAGNLVLGEDRSDLIVQSTGAAGSEGATKVLVFAACGASLTEDQPMQIPETGPANSMTEQDCWHQLSAMTLGRLATSIDAKPDIFPVNFVVRRRTILIRTAEGSKLAAISTNPWVAFEVDDHEFERGWSVVVHGHAELLEYGADIALAEKAQVLPWTASAKPRFIRIEPTRISGRRFAFGAQSGPA